MAAPRPAAIIGMPVGFVGSAESKLALVEHPGHIPSGRCDGRRGGSALCAAAINALAREDELRDSAPSTAWGSVRATRS